MCVINRDHVLNDNRSRIQLARHEMRRRPDHLHATLKRLMIGPSPCERGQERMMDVDDARWKTRTEPGAEYSHIFCQDQEIRLIPLDNRQHFRLMRLAVALSGRNVMKKHL